LKIEQSGGQVDLIRVAQAGAVGYGEKMRKIGCHRPFAIVILTWLALLSSIVAAAAASTPPTKRAIIACPFLANGRLTIDVPANRKSQPKIDFDYPAQATIFYFGDGNLFLVAMEGSRLRVVVSAQLNRKTDAYDGQIFTDTGGNEIMRDNGPVHCTVGR
jgi:hypothetical protein